MEFNLKDTLSIYGAGTSEGTLKGWDTRGRSNVQTAESHGWHQAGSWRQGGDERSRVYMHEDFPGHILTVHNDGSWESDKEGKRISDSKSLNPDHKGYGNLGQHLERFMKVSDTKRISEED